MTPRKQINIPLSDLHISKANMRKERKNPVVIDILPSIKKLGLLCPLLVREEKNGWGVVAGRRRWHCLKLIEKEAGNPVSAPCIVLGADDDATAIEASILENIARLPPTETQQFEAFGKLDDEGQSVEDIAQTFGITELAVRRVLALANLDPAIRKLYATDEIDRETARALTLASAEQQAEWLRRLASETERAPVRSECKRWVTGGAIIPAKHALFDLAEYPGTILDDLFGENAVFADPDQFWEAQNTAIAEKVQAIKVSGWQDVIIMERGETFYSYQHTERPKTNGGKVFVEVRHNGEVIFHEGYITDAEDRKERKQSQIDRATEPEVKPEMTGPMAQFIGEHRSRNVKADLLEKPGHALRLTVALTLQGSQVRTLYRPPLFYNKNKGLDELRK